MSDEKLISGLNNAVRMQPVRTMVNTPSGLRVFYAAPNGTFLAEFQLFCMDQNILADLLADAAGACRMAIVRAPAGLADQFKT